MPLLSVAPGLPEVSISLVPPISLKTVVNVPGVLLAGPSTPPTSVQKPSRFESGAYALGTAVDAKSAHDSTSWSNILGAQDVLE